MLPMFKTFAAVSPLRSLCRKSIAAYTPGRLAAVRQFTNYGHIPTALPPIAQTRAVPAAALRTRQWSRSFSAAVPMRHGHLTKPKPGEELHVSFIDKDGEKYDFEVAEGDNLLDIAQANDLEMEGACGGSCACSTCHIIVEDPELYEKIPEPDDDENDMLDLAFGLTETSRLGCQVKMTRELDGLVVRLPSMTRNMQASDFSS